ncbi:hypothetical protein V6N11_077515 [Hibiscus sabdariffa]|uniref:Uncharacterized protein n=1 Tax=Hibiscus sabdariffa TaxID=183260 RepID=A0ABR2TDC1_9ROSI
MVFGLGHGSCSMGAVLEVGIDGCLVVGVIGEGTSGCFGGGGGVEQAVSSMGRVGVDGLVSVMVWVVRG